jgi:arabinogalactan endo-1,4-beta-galactosidase
VTNKWWNAALYNHSTGKPYAAFYELKNFAEGSAGISSVRSNRRTDDSWYSLDGRRYIGKPDRKGIYINNGRKVTNI